MDLFGGCQMNTVVVLVNTKAEGKADKTFIVCFNCGLLPICPSLHLVSLYLSCSLPCVSFGSSFLSPISFIRSSSLLESCLPNLVYLNVFHTFYIFIFHTLYIFISSIPSISFSSMPYLSLSSIFHLL